MIKDIYRQYKIWNLRRKGLIIGDNCRIGKSDFGSEPYLVSIGNRVTISGNVQFITHDGGTWVFREDTKYKKVIKFGRIVVHDNSFIGFGSIILPGVSIGPNSVVAAGSLVTKDVLPNSVFAGHPAKFLMTVEEYAEKCLLKNLVYNQENLLANKRDELLKVLPLKNKLPVEQ